MPAFAGVRKPSQGSPAKAGPAFVLAAGADRTLVKITPKQGETFIGRTIALVEGAARHRAPNEIALTILLAPRSRSCSCWPW